MSEWGYSPWSVEATPVHMVLLLVALVVGFGIVVKVFMAFGQSLHDATQMLSEENLKPLEERGVEVRESPFYQPLHIFTSFMEVVASLLSDPKTIAALIAAGILSTVIFSFRR